MELEEFRKIICCNTRDELWDAVTELFDYFEPKVEKTSNGDLRYTGGDNTAVEIQIKSVNYAWAKITVGEYGCECNGTILLVCNMVKSFYQQTDLLFCNTKISKESRLNEAAFWEFHAKYNDDKFYKGKWLVFQDGKLSAILVKPPYMDPTYQELYMNTYAHIGKL